MIPNHISVAALSWNMIVGHYSLGTLILALLRDSRKGKSWVSLFSAIKLNNI